MERWKWGPIAAAAVSAGLATVIAIKERPPDVAIMQALATMSRRAPGAAFTIAICRSSRSAA